MLNSIVFDNPGGGEQGPDYDIIGTEVLENDQSAEDLL
jgi:hypothetical protein